MVSDVEQSRWVSGFDGIRCRTKLMGQRIMWCTWVKLLVTALQKWANACVVPRNQLVQITPPACKPLILQHVSPPLAALSCYQLICFQRTLMMLLLRVSEHACASNSKTQKNVELVIEFFCLYAAIWMHFAAWQVSTGMHSSSCHLLFSCQCTLVNQAIQSNSFCFLLPQLSLKLKVDGCRHNTELCRTAPICCWVCTVHGQCIHYIVPTSTVHNLYTCVPFIL